jgi:hypothetical protein
LALQTTTLPVLLLHMQPPSEGSTAHGNVHLTLLEMWRERLYADG